MKVITIVGTRPEIIRLSRVMSALDRYVDHKIVHTGQNYDYELNEIFFDDLEIRKPDIFLNAVGETAAETIGNVIAKSDKVLREETPDAVLILGDTNSCLAAISAKRLKIPVFHMEAGNRCFDFRVPEEINRRIVDHVSDINLPYSTISRDYLIREGIDPARVIKTGSPMYEILHHYLPKIKKSNSLAEFGVEEGKYILVSSHREENIDFPDQFDKLINMLNWFAANYNEKVIVSTHPRTRKMMETKGVVLHENIVLNKPLGFCDYVNLQMKARVVLSDSGTISEESSILNFPALNIRNAHERPEANEEGTVIMTGLELDVIKDAMKVLDCQKRGDERTLRIVEDYSMPNVSEKVVRIILGYTGYTNRTIWHK